MQVNLSDVVEYAEEAGFFGVDYAEKIPRKAKTLKNEVMVEPGLQPLALRP